MKKTYLANPYPLLLLLSTSLFGNHSKLVLDHGNLNYIFKIDDVGNILNKLFW